jgi:hypothetical protein
VLDGEGSAGRACRLRGDDLIVRRPWRATQGVLTGRAAGCGCVLSTGCVSRGSCGCARDGQSASDSATLVVMVEVTMGDGDGDGRGEKMENEATGSASLWASVTLARIGTPLNGGSGRSRGWSGVPSYLSFLLCIWARVSSSLNQ